MQGSQTQHEKRETGVNIMAKNLINYDDLKVDLTTVVGKSNLTDAMIGVMVGRLDDQPTLTKIRNGQTVVELCIKGTKYWLSNRNGSIWMHSIPDSMVMGRFSIKNPSFPGVYEVFEQLTVRN
jgi:hypothetical protein